MKTAASVFALALSLFGVDATFATDAYLTVFDPSGSTSFTNCANWRIGSESGSSLGTAAEPIKSGYNYIVNGKTLRTPRTSATFAGDSLTIQANGILAICAGGAGREYTFPGNGVTLKAQLVSWTGNSPTIKGRVTIPAGTTTRVYDNTSSSTLTFDCELVGESTSRMWVYGYNQRKTTVLFKGDTVKDYPGQIECGTRDWSDRDKAPIFASASTLKFGSVVSPAQVTIHPYCNLSAGSASDVVSLDTLVMKTNATITVVYDKSSKTASCIKVSGIFTHNEGPVKIDVTGNGTTYDCDWPDSALPILKAPSGVTLSTNDFTVVAAWPAYDLSVRTTEDGLSPLFIRQHGKVIQQQSDDVLNQQATS